jgi:hypothetical protein
MFYPVFFDLFIMKNLPFTLTFPSNGFVAAVAGADAIN